MATTRTAKDDNWSDIEVWHNPRGTKIYIQGPGGMVSVGLDGMTKFLDAVADVVWSARMAANERKGGE